MKKYLTFILFAFILSSTITFANNEQLITNENMETSVFVANNQNPDRYRVRNAKGWNKIDEKWQDWESLITIIQKSNKMYMWELGGYTSPVKASDIKTYDYMVDEPEKPTKRSRVRYYFNARDLEKKGF